MALYRKISPTFWTDSKIAGKFTVEDRYLYIYLLTNPHANICGCYEISIKQMSIETGLSERKITAALKRLETVHGVIVYDPDTEEVLIPKWGKHNWTTSDKLVSGVASVARYIKSRAFKEFVTAAITYGIDTVSIPYRYPIDTSIIHTSDSDSDSVSVSVNNNKYNISTIGDKKIRGSGGKEEKGFEAFWAAYPKKINKPGAQRAFAKVDVPLETLLKAIETQRRSRQWTEAGGQYIPYPATWLNQRRWEDEVTAEAAEDRPEPTPIYDLSKLVEYPPGSGLYRPPEEVPHDS